MNKVLAIFKRDLKRILHNPVAVIVTIGVCIIPSLYAWFNIAANWDPYKNTQDVPVAIVNLDKGTNTDSTGYICAGDLVVEALDKNRQLDWEFMGEKEAVNGVKAGDYYAAIVIPENFSGDLASILTGHIKSPDLVYYVNEKQNAIAPKVTDTGASTIEEEINSEFVKTVADVVTEKVEALDTKISKNTLNANSQITQALNTSKQTVEKLDALVDKTDKSCAQAHDSIKSAKSELSQIQGTTTNLSTKLLEISGVFTQTRTNTNDLWSQVNSSMVLSATKLSNVAIDANYSLTQAYTKVVSAQAQVQSVIDQLTKIQNDKQALLDDIQDISDILNNPFLLEKQIKDLHQQIDKYSDQINKLQEQHDALSRKAQIIKDLSDSTTKAVNTSSTAIIDLQKDLSEDSIPKLTSALDSFSQASALMSGNVESLQPTIQNAMIVLDQLDTTIYQAENACLSTKNSLSGVMGLLDGASTDLSALQSSATYKKLTSSVELNRETLSEFMGRPVNIKDEAIFPVKNYGTGVTPFYTNLALWVGGFVLVAIYKLEVDEEGIGSYKPWQGYFGRWLLLNLLGQIQAIICCVGDLVMGIQCVSPAAFIFAGMFASFVFINIIYSLSVAFKHIGKAFGVLLVILQIPGSSGMYPIEMMPRFFQNLYPWLPFTYGINAMREAIAGFYANYYAYNLKMLLLFVIPSLLVGVTMRRHLLNINSLFDRKLAETDMMISERVGINDVHFRLSTILKATMNASGYKEVYLERAAHFELLYPTLIKRGFVLVFVIPITLLILVFTCEDKLTMLIWWIISIVVIFTFLIVVEFLHERVNEKTDLASLSQDELYQLLGDQLKQEWMAFAPLEKIIKAKSTTEKKLTAEAILKAKQAERAAQEVTSVEIASTLNDKESKGGNL